MATETTNLKLQKDAVTDYYDVLTVNANLDKIDAAVSAARAAGDYEETKAYAAGDYCTHDGKLYRCATAIPAGEAWNAAHWAETSLGAEMKAVYAGLTAHTGSRSNPHGVTAAQAGAIPSGGDGKIKTLITDAAANSTQGGTYYGVVYHDPDHAESGLGSMRGTNGMFWFMNCSYTGYAKETELGGRGFYKNARNPCATFPQAVGTTGQDGKLLHYKSQAGRKAYGQDEIIPMDVFEILDTGNMAALGVAKAVTLTATVPTGWTASGGFYYKQVSVAGMLETDNPIVDILPGSDNAANKLYAEAWGKVQSADTLAGAVKLWATEAPAVAFPLQFKVVR